MNGRPRLTCSDACRRARDRASRRLARRVACRDDWRAAGAAGDERPGVVRREVATLTREIRELARAAGRDGDV